MGTQQILLLGVGAIVVLLMISTGVSLFNNYAVSSNRENLITTLHMIADMVEAHYNKPAELGGGGGSYVGWTLPTSFRRTDMGRFSANIKANRVNLVARGVEYGEDPSKVVRIRLRVRSTGRTLQILN